MAYGDGVYGAGVYGSGEVSGSLDAVLPTSQAAVSGTFTPLYVGAVAATFAVASVSVVGAYDSPFDAGQVDADLVVPVVAFSGGYTPPPVAGSLSAQLPLVAPSLAGTFMGTDILGSLDATLPAFAVSLRGETTWGRTLRNTVAARNRAGTGYATWEPAVDPIPAGLAATQAHDTALAFTTPVMVGAQPMVEVTTATQQRLRDRIIVGGRDVTYFRGAPTQVDGYQLLQPFMYGTATLNFPQVRGNFEQPAWMAPGKRVKIQRVDAAGTVVETDYKGVVLAINNSGASVSLEVGGEITGPASVRFKPLPLFQSSADLGRLTWRAVNSLGARIEPRMGPTTGIELGRFGGSYYLDYLLQLLGRAWTRSGNQWTVMPNDNGVYRITRKDRSTIHGTVYLDDANAVGDLRRDVAEEPNRIYATGVTPAGQRVRFGRYPGLEQAETAPLFPGPLSEGDTGDGVVTLKRRLETHGYLTRADTSTGYDAATTEAVASLQEDAGLAVTGNVNQATWFAAFDIDVVGFSLKWSRIEPAAQRPATRRYRTSATGAIIGRNPNYDPSRLVVDREVDFGAGFTRQQMREWSKTEIVDGGPDNWVGSIRINTGAIVAGDHTPGNPITSILAARDIRPGMNLSLPLFAGGTNVHVTAVRVAADVVTLDVDTRARDAWNVAQVIERDRESRRDPARAFFRKLAASSVINDAVDEWSEVGGVIDAGVNLRGGEWTVFEVVGGQAGTVRSMRLDTTPNAEFVAAVFGKKVWPKALQRLVGNPLATEGSERWADETVRNRLERDHALLYAAGDRDNPGGYSPGTKGEGAAIFTGRLIDDAGFSYYTDKYPVLYVGVWSDRDTTIPAGRIMWPQLEAGV